MSVELRLTEDKLTAVLNGEIDHHTGRALRDAIDKKISQTKPSELILDFSGVTFMDSSGIGLILGRYRWMQDLGGSVRITHISSGLEQLLVLSGIHKLVQVESEQSSKEEPQKESAEERKIFSDSSKALQFQGK